MSARRATLLRFILWTMTSWLLGFPAIGRIGSSVVGDPGDAMFNLAVLRWGARSAESGFSNYWSGQIFHTAHLPMAYSDTHLGLVPIFAPLNWLFGSVVAMNLIYLGLFVVALESSWRLCLRVCGHRWASGVGALVFTYSTIRLGQANHFQLMLGALLPLIALMVWRVTDNDGSWRHAVTLGLSLAVITLSASYLGIAAVMMVAGLVAFRLPSIVRSPRALVIRLALAGVLAAVLVGPVAIKYLELQDDPYFTRDPSTTQGTSIEGMTEVQGSTRLMDVLVDRTTPYSENRSFPGVVGVVFGLIGIGVVCRQRWWKDAGFEQNRRGEVLSLGVVCLVISVISFGNSPLFDAAGILIPGFSGIRALVRLIVVGQLAVAVLAAVGVATTMRLLADRPRLAVGLCAGLAAVVLGESALDLPLSRTPLGQSSFMSVSRELEGRAKGPVLELPAPPPSTGALWAFTEAPRMVAAGEDGQVRVNGYSGFFPKWYESEMSSVNDPSSLAGQEVLAHRGVRFIVFRTAPFVSDDGSDGLISPAGSAWMNAADAEREVAELPPATVERVDRVDGGIIVTLR